MFRQENYGRHNGLIEAEGVVTNLLREREEALAAVEKDREEHERRAAACRNASRDIAIQVQTLTNALAKLTELRKP